MNDNNNYQMNATELKKLRDKYNKSLMEYKKTHLCAGIDCSFNLNNTCLLYEITEDCVRYKKPNEETK